MAVDFLGKKKFQPQQFLRHPFGVDKTIDLSILRKLPIPNRTQTNLNPPPPPNHSFVNTE